jgi:hypothetical protein
MTAMTPLSRPFVLLRAHRVLGVSGFIVLLLVVAGERRLAEAHFNLRSTATALENSDALDSDEIRIRLVVVNDDRAPTLPAVRFAFHARAVARLSGHAVSRLLGQPTPRGPPASLVFRR